MKKTLRPIRSWITSPPEWLLVGLVIALLLFFSYDTLTVRITDINYWDEARYIIRGKELTQGTLPEFSWSPLTAATFALLYLPFRGMGNWLPTVASLGRILIYLLSLLSLYLIAREVKAIPRPVAILAAAAVYPAQILMLKFQSDALFALLSGFALWQVLRYRNTGQARSLWLASMFCGLAALTRNDGLILFAAFLLIVFLLLRKKELPITKKLAASLLPFTGLVAGYLLLYAAVTGSFHLGTSQRTYVAFLQGQYFIYPAEKDCQTTQLACATEKAEALYGTGAENDYSVLKAILNNPPAFADRLLRSVKQIPRMVFRAYGGRTAFSLILLAAVGVYELFQKKQTRLLLILAAWMLYLPVYFLTFFRDGYFHLPYYVLYLLTILGALGIVRLFQEKPWRWGIIASLALLTLGGLLLRFDAMYFTAGLLLAALLAGFWAGSEDKPQPRLALMWLLVAGLILHGSFDPISLTRQATQPEEDAILLMFEKFPRDSKVVAGAPGAVASAHMSFLPVGEFSAESPEEYHQALVSEGAAALYIDHLITNTNSHLWALIEPGIGELYERIYSGDNGSIQVLEVLP